MKLLQIIARFILCLIGGVSVNRRELGLLASFELTGDETADMARIAEVYVGREGFHHENASPIRLL